MFQTSRATPQSSLWESAVQDTAKPSSSIASRGLLELTNFQEGFREALPYWLNQAFSTTQDRVERAVQVDQVTPVFVEA